MTPRHRGAAALLAATVINLPFGTLYAFSVFLKPMEALLGATRAEMGFVFGLATVSLTVGKNVAPQLYRRLSPVALALGSGLTSALGLVLAAQAQGFTAFARCYGGRAVRAGSWRAVPHFSPGGEPRFAGPALQPWSLGKTLCAVPRGLM